MKLKANKERIYRWIARAISPLSLLLYDVKPQEVVERWALVIYIRSMLNISKSEEMDHVEKAVEQALLAKRESRKIAGDRGLFTDETKLGKAVLVNWYLCLDNPELSQKQVASSPTNELLSNVASLEDGTTRRLYYKWELTRKALHTKLRKTLDKFISALEGKPMETPIRNSLKTPKKKQSKRNKGSLEELEDPSDNETDTSTPPGKRLKPSTLTTKSEALLSDSDGSPQLPTRNNKRATLFESDSEMEKDEPTNSSQNHKQKLRRDNWETYSSVQSEVVCKSGKTKQG